MVDQFAATHRQLADLQRSIAELQRQFEQFPGASKAPKCPPPSTTINDCFNSTGISGFISTTDMKKLTADGRTNSAQSDDASRAKPISMFLHSDSATSATGNRMSNTGSVSTASRCVKKSASVVDGHDAIAASYSKGGGCLLHRQNALVSLSDDGCSPERSAAVNYGIWRPQSADVEDTTNATQRQWQKQPMVTSASPSQT